MQLENKFSLAETIKEHAQKSKAFSDMCYVFAMRARTRRQVTY